MFSAKRVFVACAVAMCSLALSSPAVAAAKDELAQAAVNCARGGTSENVQRLLASGAPTKELSSVVFEVVKGADDASAFGKTCLTVLDLLLKAGADPNPLLHGTSALQWARNAKHTKAADLLLKHRALDFEKLVPNCEGAPKHASASGPIQAYALAMLETRCGETGSELAFTLQGGRYVIADVARLRSAPSEKARVLGLLRIGARVKPTGVTRNKWVEVEAPDTGIAGWLTAQGIRTTQVSVVEARAALQAVQRSASKADLLAWADRLRALSPATPADLSLALETYRRVGEVAKARAAEEALVGHGPIYFAACVESKVVVIAEFRRTTGLKDLPMPLKSLAAWIGAAPWHYTPHPTDDVRLVAGGRFAGTKYMPKTQQHASSEEGPGDGELEKVVLESSCGGDIYHDAPLATWPFRRVRVANAAVEGTDGEEPQSEGEAPMGETSSHTSKAMDVIELQLGTETHRFRFDYSSTGDESGASSGSVSVTHLKGEAAASEVTLALHSRDGC